MSIWRRLWAGLRLAVLAGTCGVVLALAVVGSVTLAYRWGEAQASSTPDRVVHAAVPKHPSAHGGSRT